MIKCSHCDKEFKYVSEKNRHEESHDPRYKCNECSKNFSFLSALKRHEKQHKRTSSVKCDDCGRYFKDDILLARHVKYAHKGITCYCPKCNVKFNSELALSSHLKTHQPASVRKYRCTYIDCDKSFNFAHHLKHHELTHYDKKEHFCNLCGKGFIQAHHLKTHLKTHDQKNLLNCTAPLCKKTFHSEYALKRHLDTHNSLLCSSCGQVVSVTSSENHMLKCMPNKEAPLEELASVKKMIPDLSNLHNYVNQTDTTNIIKRLSIKEEDSSIIQTKDKHQIHLPCDDYLLINSQFQAVKAHLESKTNKCNGCDCSEHSCNVQDNNDSLSYTSSSNNVANIEYKNDGTIKLKESFDFEFELDRSLNNNSSNGNKNTKNELNFVLYNSCKDILGKCIVSGNGTISEECLCAKMAVHDQQMIPEEVDEITPKPMIS